MSVIWATESKFFSLSSCGRVEGEEPRVDSVSSAVRLIYSDMAGLLPALLMAHRHLAEQTQFSVLSPGLLVGMLAQLNNFLPKTLPAFHSTLSWSSWCFWAPFCLCLLIICRPHPAHPPSIWALGFTVPVFSSSTCIFSLVASFGDTTLNTSPPSPRIIVQLLTQ